MQGAANRKTSVGFTGLASCNKSSVTGLVVGKKSTLGLSAVPRTIPIALLPSHSGCALGQRVFFLFELFITRDVKNTNWHQFLTLAAEILSGGWMPPQII
jgi:hypothetical protein